MTVLLLGYKFITDIFVVFENTGVFMLVLNRSLGTNVKITLTVLVPILVLFAVSMWPVFPLDETDANPTDSIEFLMLVWSLLLMTFTGGSLLRQAGNEYDLEEFMSVDWTQARAPSITAQHDFASKLWLTLMFLAFIILAVGKPPRDSNLATLPFNPAMKFTPNLPADIESSYGSTPAEYSDRSDVRHLRVSRCRGHHAVALGIRAKCDAV